MTTTSTTTPRRRGPAALNAQKVETYLREHPEFFIEHTDLLEIIRIPHITGKAISLIERQVSVLREKNSALQAQMADLIEIARENDVLTRRVHQLTLALLGAHDPESPLKALETGLYQHFQIDRVAVRCFRNCNDPVLSSLWLEREDERLNAYRECMDQADPWCGPCNEAGSLEFLFGDDADIRSFALIPLNNPGFQGLLALGSHDADRFTPGMGVLFLRILGEMVAARLAALWISRHGGEACKSCDGMSES